MHLPPPRQFGYYREVRPHLTSLLSRLTGADPIAGSTAPVSVVSPHTRMSGDGAIAPVDGIVIGAGPIARDTILYIHGVPLELRRLVTGRGPALELAAFAGGRYFTTLLPGRGERRVLMPISGSAVELRWVPAIPQRDGHERVAVRCRSADGFEFFVVLVGGSAVDGIHLAGRERSSWARPGPIDWRARLDRGEPLGHVTGGATVVLLVPPPLAGPPPATGTSVRMGERLW